MRRGFTILELLVASLLLSMLVTMLTMIFNQSSIAWRTAAGSVADLKGVRMRIGAFHESQDEALPGLAQNPGTIRNVFDTSRNVDYRTVSVFRKWNGSGKLVPANASDNCSGRLFDRFTWNISPQISMSDAIKGQSLTISTSAPGTSANNGQNAGSVSPGGFIVGVRSAGPDREFDKEGDNITTFPEEVD